MNGIFLPMFMQGLAGMNRRLYDGGRTVFVLRRASRARSRCQAWSAVLLGVVQLIFIVNFFWSLRRGARVDRQSVAGDDARVDDDVAAAARQLRGARRPCIAGRTTTACRRRRRFHAAEPAVIPYTIERRADTGVTNVTLGIWLFLASEVMLFGALFSAYALLRVVGAGVAGRRRRARLPLGAANTLVLVLMTLAAAWRARSATWPSARRLLLVCAAAGARVPGDQGRRVRRRDRPRPRAVGQHVPRDVLHADRTARPARRRRRSSRTSGRSPAPDACRTRLTRRPRPRAVALLGVRGRRLARHLRVHVSVMTIVAIAAMDLGSRFTEASTTPDVVQPRSPRVRSVFGSKSPVSSTASALAVVVLIGVTTLVLAGFACSSALSPRRRSSAGLMSRLLPLSQPRRRHRRVMSSCTG